MQDQNKKLQQQNEQLKSEFIAHMKASSEFLRISSKNNKDTVTPNSNSIINIDVIKRQIEKREEEMATPSPV